MEFTLYKVYMEQVRLFWFTSHSIPILHTIPPFIGLFLHQADGPFFPQCVNAPLKN